MDLRNRGCIRNQQCRGRKKASNVSQLIVDGAGTFLYYLRERNGEQALDWKTIRYALLKKYEHTEERQDLLRQQLSAVKFHGIAHTTEYIDEFRAIEIQILEESFSARLEKFVKNIPVGMEGFIKDRNLDEKDMEVVYREARLWASRRMTMKTETSNSHSHRRHSHKSLLRKEHRRPSTPAPTIKKNDSEDELDAIDMTQITCFNCNQNRSLRSQLQSLEERQDRAKDNLQVEIEAEVDISDRTH